MTEPVPTEGPPAFTPPDQNLWVMVRGAGKVYVLGNAHTHFGRIAGYAESISSGYIFSLSEVEDASPTAYDHAKKAGLIGMVKRTVRELSTNRKYFEGFGSS